MGLPPVAKPARQALFYIIFDINSTFPHILSIPFPNGPPILQDPMEVRLTLVLLLKMWHLKAFLVAFFPFFPCRPELP